MALHLPPAVSINRFDGGYKSVSNYADLTDTETSDAKNTIYGPDKNISQRPGSLRLYNSRLFSTSETSTARPITGHYYFTKLGANTSFHIVAAGDNLFNYTSSTANSIRSTLTDNSNTFWNFIQIQDPRSAADDIVLMTNGVDPIQVWNGSASALALSSFTSATSVPVCDYLFNHKERVYAFNITDSTDADAAVKVVRTGFGADGNADPHRFTETLYVGGSSKDGSLNGGKVLNDQIIFYKRSAIWKFNPGSGDVNDLIQIQDRVGLLAPYSLISTGDFHIFLSDDGVMAFDGNNLVPLSEKVDKDLFDDANVNQLQFAKAEYDSDKAWYILYFASAGSNRNDRGLIYDLRNSMKCWQPPVTGRRVNFISNFMDSNNTKRILYGDYHGYLYEDLLSTNKNDGFATGYNGSVSVATLSTLTDSAANFTTAGNGLAGALVRIIEGAGEGQERVIESNTTAAVTLESGSTWTVIPDTTSRYTVAGIDADWRSRDYDFGGHDIVKLFRQMDVKTKEEGNINLTVNYIVDFAQFNEAGSAVISLYQSGFVWGISRWDQVAWGGKEVIRRRVQFRSTARQGMIGNYLSVRFSNRRANETFKISGYDITLKAVGKR